MKALCAAGLILSVAAWQAVAEMAWCPNYEAAAKQSKDDRRDLFVFVSGSGWSAAARAYKKSVIQSPMLEQALGKEFLWLEIDRPDQATAEHKAVAQKNQGFEVVIRNYPGVVLLDAEGRCYLKLEAPQGGVDGLIAAVKQARALKVRRDAELELAAKASGLERGKHLAAALDMMGDFVTQNGRHSHRALLEELAKLDPQDITGTQRRFTFNPDQFAEGQVWPLVGEKKYAEALALVDKELKDPRNNTWLNQHFLGLRFYVFQSQDKLEEAVKVLQQIISLDGRTDMANLARGYLDNITKPVVLAEAKWKPEHLRSYFADWRLDVSQMIQEKGSYEIEFKRADGDSIIVRDVALVSGNKELAKADLPPNASKLELRVDALPAGQKTWLKIAAKGQGWFGSRGDILIRKK